MQKSAQPRSFTLQAYRDFVDMVRQMGPVLAVLSVLYILCAMSWFIAPMVVPTWIGRYVLRMLIFVCLAWAAAPFYVALHRFVAIGEVRWLPNLGDYSREAQVYAAYAGMTTALYFLPFVGREILVALGAGGLASLAFLVLLVGLWIVLVRSTTLLPMAALAPNSASWGRAFAQSRGRAWGIFLVSAGLAAPSFVILMMLSSAAGQRAIEPVPFFALAIPALLAMQLLPLSHSTRLFQRLSAAR